MLSEGIKPGSEFVHNHEKIVSINKYVLHFGKKIQLSYLWKDPALKLVARP